MPDTNEKPSSFTEDEHKLIILYNDILCEILQQPGLPPRVEELVMQGIELIGGR